METEKISDIFLHPYLSNITTSGHINISMKLHSSRQCLCSHPCLSVLCGPVSLPVVVHGSRIVERLPDHLQQSSPARLPPTRGHGGQHGEQPRREGHGRCWDPHQRRSRPVQLQYRLVTYSIKQCLTDYSFLPSLQSWPLWWRIKFWWLRDHQALSLNLKVYPVHLEKHQQRELLRQSPAKIDQYGNYSSLISLYAKLS